ncbi:MAG: DUF4272 domain-containing protein [Isosphaeraceae bacterium]
MEPITLFARIVDPAGVARLIREFAPEVEIDGPDDDWRNAAISFGEGQDKRTLSFTHDPAYYSEPNWSSQVNGMRGYFSRFPETDRKERVLMLTTTFRFSLGTLFDPDFDPDDDPRLDVLFAVAERLDGVLFTPSSLRDASGRILYGAGGEEDEDPDAVWPRVIGEVSASEPFGAAIDQMSRPNRPAPEDGEPAPPTATRVARRALALTAVTVRAVLEQDAGKRSATATYRDLLAWARDLGIEEEIEPDEWEVIQRPLGRLEPRQQIDSTWRLEGLVVLAWALGLSKLPTHDQLVSMHLLWSSLGWPDSGNASGFIGRLTKPTSWRGLGSAGPGNAARLLAGPVLRPRNEIVALRKRLFAIHWRLRNFELRPEVMDFAEFARTCWFGPLDLSGLPLVEGDLGLRGERLDRASEDVFSTAHSAAQERHQAANWLCEGPERYAEASVST